MTAASSEPHSLASSPTSARTHYTCSPYYCTTPITPHGPSAYPIPTVPDIQRRRRSSESDSDPGTEDRNKLYEINQQIKATLTELLNTDSVKHDYKFRAWIQGRLMDAEMEMRRQRRRRSSVEDREVAESIAEHFEHGPFRFD